MNGIWESMGFIRWPLSFSTVIAAVLIVWSAVQLFRPGASPDLRTKAWVDGVLFWGAFALLTGVLGSLVGIIVASQAIEAAGEVSTRLVWGGIRLAMLSSAVGVLILVMAGLAWFVLQLRWRFLSTGR